jgi:O-antigen ligase
MIFFLYYAAITLVTGTISGLAHPLTNAVTTALLVATILAGVFLRPSARLGGGGDWACVAFLGVAFLTAWFAICPERSLHLAVQFVAAAVLFYLMLDSSRQDLAPAMAVVATLAAIVGLGAWWLGVTPRVTAPFGLHHYAAGFLLLHLPVTWSLVRQTRQPLWIFAVAMQAAAIIGTRSMAAVVVLGLMLLWTLRRKPLFLIAALGALVAVAVLVPRTHQLLTRGEDPSLSTENRVRYLQTGVAMFEARPLGWGLGSVPLVSAPFRPQVPDIMPQGEVLPHLHNLPLQAAVETGVLGLLAAAWFLWRGRSVNIVPYLLFAMADYQLDLPALLLAFAAVAGWSVRAKATSAGKDACPTNNTVARASLPAALLVVAALAPFTSLCGWDDFLGKEYVVAAAQLPDLIPISSAAGASLTEAGK